MNVEHTVIWSGRGSLPGAQDWPAQRQSLYISNPDAIGAADALRAPRGPHYTCPCGKTRKGNALRCEGCYALALDRAVELYKAKVDFSKAATLEGVAHTALATRLARLGLRDRTPRRRQA